MGAHVLRSTHRVFCRSYRGRLDNWKRPSLTSPYVLAKWSLDVSDSSFSSGHLPSLVETGSNTHFLVGHWHQVYNTESANQPHEIPPNAVVVHQTNQPPPPPRPPTDHLQGQRCKRGTCPSVPQSVLPGRTPHCNPERVMRPRESSHKMVGVVLWTGYKVAE